MVSIDTEEEFLQALDEAGPKLVVVEVSVVEVYRQQQGTATVEGEAVAAVTVAVAAGVPGMPVGEVEARMLWGTRTVVWRSEGAGLSRRVSGGWKGANGPVHHWRLGRMLAMTFSIWCLDYRAATTL